MTISLKINFRRYSSLFAGFVCPTTMIAYSTRQVVVSETSGGFRVLRLRKKRFPLYNLLVVEITRQFQSLRVKNVKTVDVGESLQFYRTDGYCCLLDRRRTHTRTHTKVYLK